MVSIFDHFSYLANNVQQRQDKKLRFLPLTELDVKRLLYAEVHAETSADIGWLVAVGRLSLRVASEQDFVYSRSSSINVKLIHGRIKRDQAHPKYTK